MSLSPRQADALRASREAWKVACVTASIDVDTEAMIARAHRWGDMLTCAHQCGYLVTQHGIMMDWIAKQLGEA